MMAFMLPLGLIAGGTLLTYVYEDHAPVMVRFCGGACIGFAFFGLAGFVFASLFGFNLIAVALTLLTAASPSLLLATRQNATRMYSDIQATVRNMRGAIVHPNRRTTTYFVFYTLIGVLLWHLVDRAMFVRNDGIYTGLENNIGDLPFHLGIVTRFTQGENFPPEHPEFAGARFTYPFLIDFVAALFVRGGMSLADALFVQNIVLALALVGLIHRWALTLTRDRVAALISPLLILFNGGLGWWLLIHEAYEGNPGFFPLLRSPRHYYTIVWGGPWGDALRWGNSLTTLFLPQRNILLGLSLFIIVWTLWWQVVGDATTEPERALETWRMMAAGAMGGLLPLTHAHAFIALMGMAACLAALFWRRAWLAFFAVAFLLAVPQIWWVTRGSLTHAESFIGWHFGWAKGDQNFLLFWFKNTGLFIPLLLTAILLRGRRQIVRRQLLIFYLPFTFCFIIPNLLRLAPWEWDNIKVLFFWYVASAPLVALLLARLWREVSRAAAIVLLLSLTLAGSLDVWRVVAKTSEYRVFDSDGITFADVISRSAPPGALILNAPTFNHPIFLAGRRSLMGYPGHLWSHGLDYTAREADIRRIYLGAPDAERLMMRYGIDYAVVGPLERAVLPINERFFARYQKVGEAGEYRLYQITRRQIGDKQ